MAGSGRCECGGVRYRTEAELRPVFNCHCERCRRITGHFMASSGCPMDALIFVADDTLRWYEPAPGVFYGFCGRCGGTLFWKADGVPDWISICAGTLDQPSGLTTVAAWWTAEAADYHRLDSSLTQHAYESGEAGSDA